MKRIVGTVATVLVACVVVGLGYAAFTWYDERGLPPKPRYTTQAALLNATPARAADTLRRNGHVLAAPLSCHGLPGVTRRSLRLTCTGTTIARQKVQVIAAAELPQRAEFFTILVGGKPLVQNTRCLGTDCKRHKG